MIDSSFGCWFSFLISWKLVTTEILSSFPLFHLQMSNTQFHGWHELTRNSSQSSFVKRSEEESGIVCGLLVRVRDHLFQQSFGLEIRYVTACTSGLRDFTTISSFSFRRSFPKCCSVRWCFLQAWLIMCYLSLTSQKLELQRSCLLVAFPWISFHHQHLHLQDLSFTCCMSLFDIKMCVFPMSSCVNEFPSFPGSSVKVHDDWIQHSGEQVPSTSVRERTKKMRLVLL